MSTNQSIIDYPFIFLSSLSTFIAIKNNVVSLPHFYEGVISIFQMREWNTNNSTISHSRWEVELKLNLLQVLRSQINRWWVYCHFPRPFAKCWDKVIDWDSCPQTAQSVNTWISSTCSVVSQDLLHKCGPQISRVCIIWNLDWVLCKLWHGF